MWMQTFLTSITNHRILIGGVLISVLAASSSGAQQSPVLTSAPVRTGFLINMGLVTFFTGGDRTAEVTVTELGELGVTSTVRIVFYDEADRVIFRDEGVLQRGQKVHAVLRLDMPERRVQVRALITILGEPGRKTVPVMVLESIDPGSFTIEERVSCSPPEDKDGVTPWCPPPALVNTIVARG